MSEASLGLTNILTALLGLAVLVLLLLGFWKAIELTPKVINGIINRIRRFRNKNAPPTTLVDELRKKFGKRSKSHE